MISFCRLDTKFDRRMKCTINLKDNVIVLFLHFMFFDAARGYRAFDPVRPRRRLLAVPIRRLPVLNRPLRSPAWHDISFTKYMYA